MPIVNMELIEGPIMLGDLGDKRTRLAKDITDLPGDTIHSQNHQLMGMMSARPLVCLFLNTLRGSSHFIGNH